MYDKNGPPFWDDEAIKREYGKMLTRNRVRRCRERKKRQAMTAGEAHAVTGKEPPVTCNAHAVPGNKRPVTGNAKNVTCNAETVTGNAVTENASVFSTGLPEDAQPRTQPVFATGTVATAAGKKPATVTGNGNAAVTACNALVTPGNAFAKKEKENEKRKKQRKEINKNKKIFKTNIADAMPNSARTRMREEKPETDIAELFAETSYATSETQPPANAEPGTL